VLQWCQFTLQHSLQVDREKLLQEQAACQARSQQLDLAQRDVEQAHLEARMRALLLDENDSAATVLQSSLAFKERQLGMSQLKADLEKKRFATEACNRDLESQVIVLKGQLKEIAGDLSSQRDVLEQRLLDSMVRPESRTHGLQTDNDVQELKLIQELAAVRGDLGVALANCVEAKHFLETRKTNEHQHL
jgi:hypothetical protein